MLKNTRSVQAIKLSAVGQDRLCCFSKKPELLLSFFLPEMWLLSFRRRIIKKNDHVVVSTTINKMKKGGVRRQHFSNDKFV